MAPKTHTPRPSRVDTLPAEQALIIEPKLGWKDVADYTVLRPSGEPIATVAEDVSRLSLLWRALFRSPCGPSRTLRVTGPSGEPLLHVSKSWGAMETTVTVRTGAGDPLGMAESEFDSKRAATLFDPYGREGGILYLRRFGTEILFTDPDGAQLAYVTMRPTEAIFDRAGFVQYHYAVWLAPHLSGARRAVVIGVAIALDMMWFRKSRAAYLRKVRS